MLLAIMGSTSTGTDSLSSQSCKTHCKIRQPPLAMPPIRHREKSSDRLCSQLWGPSHYEFVQCRFRRRVPSREGCLVCLRRRTPLPWSRSENLKNSLKLSSSHDNFGAASYSPYLEPWRWTTTRR